MGTTPQAKGPEIPKQLDAKERLTRLKLKADPVKLAEMLGTNYKVELEEIRDGKNTSPRDKDRAVLVLFTREQLAEEAEDVGRKKKNVDRKAAA